MTSSSIYRISSAIFLLLFLSSCASLQQLQGAMDEVDSAWGKVNRKLVSEKGRRAYQVERSVAIVAAEKAVLDLGFKGEYRHNLGKIIATAITPAPFSDEEFQQVRKVEEPMMQAIAATHVGSFTSSFFYLSKGKNIVEVQISLSQGDGTGQTVIGVDFEMRPLEPSKHLVMGRNPPPEAVRLGLAKWWEAFEKQLAKP